MVPVAWNVLLKYLDVAQPTGSKSLQYRSGIVN